MGTATKPFILRLPPQAVQHLEQNPQLLVPMALAGNILFTDALCYP